MRRPHWRSWRSAPWRCSTGHAWIAVGSQAASATTAWPRTGLRTKSGQQVSAHRSVRPAIGTSTCVTSVEGSSGRDSQRGVEMARGFLSPLHPRMGRRRAAGRSESPGQRSHPLTGNLVIAKTSLQAHTHIHMQLRRGFGVLVRCLCTRPYSHVRQRAISLCRSVRLARPCRPGERPRRGGFRTVVYS